MTKTKKKRDKPYTGPDAASTNPTIRRYEAVERSKIGQWWHDKKRVVKPVGIGVGVLVVLIWIIVEGIRIIF
ncbi:MAG TPA: hypothetical protein VD907_01325 [Verrucomicrobiae bacterium]|nr:hypothetical protein [Verrucomicrobiae bacterium]